MTSEPAADPGIRGRLSFRSTSEQADRNEITLHDDTVVSFGRGEGCAVRIGHGPVRDVEMPRTAGWIVVAHGRVMIEAAPMGDEAQPATVKRALQVTFPGGPPVPISPGSAYSPNVGVFTVEVTGASQTWELDVVVRSRLDEPTSLNGHEPRTNGVSVELTELQQQVLWAYAEPVLAGGVEPATHDRVAAKVFLSRSAVRRVLDRVSDEFYEKRLWSPDAVDTRVRVVEAARHNQLLRPPSPAP